MNEKMIQARGVRKSFGHFEALRGIDLEVEAGEVVCLIGPSGSGKSTLLRCINHLESIDAGELLVDGDYVGYRRKGAKLRELEGRAAARRRAELGMVFQRFNLFPHMTARENVAIGLRKVKGIGKRDALMRAEHELQKVGLGSKMNSYPIQLSGGQQQRVGIARAVAMDPKLMLFDEPTSALDPELVREVLEVMRGLADSGMTMVCVTHEMRFAREVGGRIVFMDGGEILADGAASDLLDNPSHPRMRSFLAHLADDAPSP